MSTSKHIPFYVPDITEMEIQKVVSALESNWLAKGPKTIEFEKEFSNYTGAKYSVGLNSCTAALHLSLKAAGIKEGDEVITTSMTFAASANTIKHVGAKPVFVDIDINTGLIDVDKIEEKITSKTKAIVPVHYGGQAVDLDRIYDLADKYDLFVSEDAAHATHTEYKGRRIGAKSKGAVSFSFYATKNLATGEGGMLTTEDEELANRARVLSTHGMSRNAWNRYEKGGSWKYDIEEPGYKYNMFDIQASLGLAQLCRIEEMQSKRVEIAKRYTDELRQNECIILPETSEWTTKHAWHLYMIRLDKEKLKISRDEFIEKLNSFGIGSSVHFIPVHTMSAYNDYKGIYLPNTMSWYEGLISIPLYPTLEQENQNYIIDVINKITKEYKK